LKTVYSEEHRKRASATELYGGELGRPFECPERMDFILAALKARDHGEILAAEPHSLKFAARVHAPDYLDFLKTCWSDWQAGGYKGEAIASCWPSRAMTRARPPKEIDGRIGYFCLASETSISGGMHLRCAARRDITPPPICSVAIAS